MEFRGQKPVVNVRPPKNVCERGSRAHLLLTDLIGLQRQGTVRLHPGVGQSDMLSCHLDLQAARFAGVYKLVLAALTSVAQQAYLVKHFESATSGGHGQLKTARQ